MRGWMSSVRRGDLFVVAAGPGWPGPHAWGGASLADVLEKLEKGKIGHRAAMQWLNVESYDALVEIMHVNGKLMPGPDISRCAWTRKRVRWCAGYSGLPHNPNRNSHAGWLRVGIDG
jgi:hypothetical protein